MKLEQEKYAGELHELREMVNRYRTIFRHSLSDKTGYYFICGEAGRKDEFALPEYVFICPQTGADGFAVYTKTTEYFSTTTG